MNVSEKIIVSMCVGLVFFLSGCSNKQNDSEENQVPVARPAKIVPLTQNGTALIRTYPGTLEASQKADLAFRVAGQLIELPAHAGLQVKAGDLLAKLDPTDYQNTANERQARFDLAKTQLEQANKLLKKNLSSQLNYDQANAELKAARAALQQAQDNLRYTALKAPFDGIVARVNIENFQPVQAQVPIIEFRQDHALDIRFSVPESLLSQLRRVEDPDILANFCGEVVFSTHQGKIYRACYREHETEPDLLTRNYSGLFRLDPIDDFVALPGMSATIKLNFSNFLAQRTKQSIFAPVEAVFSEEGKQWVWLVKADMTATRQVVSVGRIEGDRIEITSELDPKSSVIAAGVSYVREGMLVKPMIKQRGL